jgi:hypothetical protein
LAKLSNSGLELSQSSSVGGTGLSNKFLREFGGLFGVGKLLTHGDQLERARLCGHRIRKRDPNAAPLAAVPDARAETGAIGKGFELGNVRHMQTKTIRLRIRNFEHPRRGPEIPRAELCLCAYA